MKSQPSIYFTDIKPADNKDWDETEELEIILTMKTKNKTKAFKGKVYKKVGVNIIE